MFYMRQVQIKSGNPIRFKTLAHKYIMFVKLLLVILQAYADLHDMLHELRKIRNATDFTSIFDNMLLHM